MSAFDEKIQLPTENLSSDDVGLHLVYYAVCVVEYTTDVLDSFGAVAFDGGGRLLASFSRNLLLVPAEDAFRAFEQWLLAFRAKRLVQLSDFPQFDSAMLDRHMAVHGTSRRPLCFLRLMFEPAIDVQSVYRGIIHYLGPCISTSEVCEEVGAEYFRLPHTQTNAVYQALEIGVNFFRICNKHGFTQY